MSFETPLRPLQAGFLAELALGFVERSAQRPHRKRQGHGVEVAHAIVVGQTGLRAHAEAVADGRRR